MISLICLPFFGVGVYEAYRSAAEIRSFAHAPGTVTGNSYLKTLNDGVESGAYYPNVEFTTANNTKIVFTDGAGSLPADYAPGASVEVVYDLENPPKARIYSAKRFWLAPAIFITVGALPVIVFLILMRRLDF